MAVPEVKLTFFQKRFSPLVSRVGGRIFLGNGLNRKQLLGELRNTSARDSLAEPQVVRILEAEGIIKNEFRGKFQSLGDLREFHLSGILTKTKLSDFSAALSFGFQSDALKPFESETKKTGIMIRAADSIWERRETGYLAESETIRIREFAELISYSAGKIASHSSFLEVLVPTVAETIGAFFGQIKYSAAAKQVELQASLLTHQQNGLFTRTDSISEQSKEFYQRVASILANLGAPSALIALTEIVEEFRNMPEVNTHENLNIIRALASLKKVLETMEELRTANAATPSARWMLQANLRAQIKTDYNEALQLLKTEKTHTGLLQDFRKWTRALAILSVPWALSGGLIYGTYRFFKPADPPRAEYSQKTTPFSPALEKAWAYWNANFTETTIDGARFVVDPSIDRRILSESMAYGLLMSVQQHDKKTFDELLSGLTKLEGRGLPAFKAHIDPKTRGLKIDSDAERTSASDADQDITFALIQAHSIWGTESNSTYKIRAQQYLNRLWDGTVQYDGHTAILKPSEDWGGATVSTGATFNASYVSPFMHEAFNRFDSNSKHDWSLLMKTSIKLRRAAIEASVLKTGTGSDVPKVAFAEVPDWVVVSWPANSTVPELFTHPNRQYTMGLDGIRTLWRIALDATHLTDPDDCIKLAREMMDKIKDVPALIDPDRKDGDPKREIKNSETALAAYATLAYAAAQPMSADKSADAAKAYDMRYRTLIKQFLGIARADGTFATGNDPDSGKRYYNQTTAWIAARIIEHGFGRFAVSLFDGSDSSPGKEGQVLRSNHRRGYLIHTEYLPLWAGGHGFIIDPEERAELDLIKRLVWLYDEKNVLGGIRGGGDSRTLRVRLLAAEELKGSTFYSEAINQFRIILENASAEKHPKESATAVADIFGAIEGANMPAEAAVKLFGEIINKNPSNPYLHLGLAQALASTFNRAYYDKNDGKAIEELNIALKAGIPSLSFGAHSLLAELHRRNADYAVRTNDNQRHPAEYKAAIDEIDLALKAHSKAAQLDPKMQPELKADLLMQKALILFQAYEASKDGKKLNEATAIYEDSAIDKAFGSIKDPQIRQEARSKKALGLSNCYKAAKKYAEALTIISDEMERINKLSKSKKSNPFEDPGYVQLTVEKIRILTLQKKDGASVDPIAEATGLLDKIPSGRLRTSFERIVYFLDKGEYEKARKDVAQLQLLRTRLAVPSEIDIVPDAALPQLKAIEQDIRNTILPELAKLIGDSSPEAKQKAETLKAALKAKIDSVAGISTKDSAVSKLFNSGETSLFEAGKYEAIAENIERAEELNATLKEYAGRPATKEIDVLLAANGIAEHLKNTADPKSIIAARTAAEAAIRECGTSLDEAPLSPKWFAAMREFYEAAIWMIKDLDGDVAARDFTRELLDEHYNPTVAQSDSLRAQLLRSLRDKEVRSGIMPPSERSKFFGIVGDLYRLGAQPVEAIKAYRKSLGLAAEPKDVASEKKEYESLLSDQPEKTTTIKNIVNLPTGDEKRDEMFGELREKYDK
ncbi:hypothetical protein HZC34_08145 [Candidatus Saganbacteria bacterium]|nr:hypothetical protein [Candidatus Saganbacteria bacterium]